MYFLEAAEWYSVIVTKRSTFLFIFLLEKAIASENRIFEKWVANWGRSCGKGGEWWERNYDGYWITNIPIQCIVCREYRDRLPRILNFSKSFFSVFIPQLVRISSCKIFPNIFHKQSGIGKSTQFSIEC